MAINGGFLEGFEGNVCFKEVSCSLEHDSSLFMGC